MLKLFSAVVFTSLMIPEIASAGEINLVEQLSEGGVALVIILFLSILFLSVSVERLINFREKDIFSYELLEDIRTLWANEEFDKIHQLLNTQNNTLSRVLGFIVNNRYKQFEFISNRAGEIASVELRRHQQKFYALAIVATVAPIVGLLGTVIGMIEAFHVIAHAQGMGNPALLAGGISKALINTAAGLSVALPALGMHHFFKHRTVIFSLLLEQEITRLITDWFSASLNGHVGSSTSTDLHGVSYAN